MYDLLMTMSLLCVLGGGLSAFGLAVSLFKGLPMLPPVVGLVGGFVGFLVFVGLADSTEEGKAIRAEREKSRTAASDAAAHDGALGVDAKDGGAGREPSQDRPKHQGAPHAAAIANAPVEPSQPRDPTALPQGFSYEVTTHDLIPNLKLSLDVRISQRLTEPQLEALSRRIVEQREDFKKVFIGYYLPGMEFGAGGWALVTMDPDPRISIMGTTSDQHAKLLQRQLPSGGRPIGTWMDHGTVGQRWTLLKRKNDFLMVMELPKGTGQAIRTPCRRRGKTSTGGRRYVPRKKSALLGVPQRRPKRYTKVR